MAPVFAAFSTFFARLFLCLRSVCLGFAFVVWLRGPPVLLTSTLCYISPSGSMSIRFITNIPEEEVEKRQFAVRCVEVKGRRGRKPLEPSKGAVNASYYAPS
jgi:hypothetical protein